MGSREKLPGAPPGPSAALLEPLGTAPCPQPLSQPCTTPNSPLSIRHPSVAALRPVLPRKMLIGMLLLC